MFGFNVTFKHLRSHGTGATHICHAADTRHDTPCQPVKGYRHRANLPLCYPLMWNVTLEYTPIQFYVSGQT